MTTVATPTQQQLPQAGKNEPPTPSTIKSIPTIPPPAEPKPNNNNPSQQPPPPVPTPVPSATKTAVATAAKAASGGGGAVRRPSVAASTGSSAPAAAAAVAAGSSSRAAKSKKKKGSGGRGGSGEAAASGENTGRWTAEEHRLFLQGLEQHGKGWKKIASLIKSRTVVQIRTHAQKYFQKLAKARQNGEDPGEISMEGRGGISTITSTSTSIGGVPTKRRRQQTGTKRKAIHSVVASAQREGKKIAVEQEKAGVPNPVPPLPMVSPILANFVLPEAVDNKNTAEAANSSNNKNNNHKSSLGSSTTTSQGTISGPALEDSMYVYENCVVPNNVDDDDDDESIDDDGAEAKKNVAAVAEEKEEEEFSWFLRAYARSRPIKFIFYFRFLTPTPVTGAEPGLNDVARQAGANPITLPTEQPSSAPTVGGEISPTGVTDLSLYPSWSDGKDAPSWYAKGADVEALLDVADTLDWLADPGDPNETYQAPAAPPAEVDTSNLEAQTSTADIAAVEAAAAAAQAVEEEDAMAAAVAAAAAAEVPSSVVVKVEGPEPDVEIPPDVVQEAEKVLEEEGLPEVVDETKMETVVVDQQLPSIFDGAPEESAEHSLPEDKGLVPSESAMDLGDAASHPPMDEPLFDTPMEEHDFVSTILEN